MHSFNIVVNYVYVANKGNYDQVVQLVIDSYTTLFDFFKFHTVYFYGAL